MPDPAFPESLLAYALATISEGSLITDAQYRTLYANAAFTAITGYSEADMLNQNCRILQGFGTDPETLQKLRQALESGTIFRGGLLNYRKDGSSFWNEVTISPLRDAQGVITHFVSVQRDISPQIDLQNQLRFQARHDQLTQLPNRFALDRHLTDSLARAACSGQVVAVGKIDIDQFKAINDTYGHAAGDLLLRELAARIQTNMHEGELLARIGGDEFVVVIEGLEAATAGAQLPAALNRLQLAIAEPFTLGPGRTVQIGISMGLALFPGDATDGDLLLRQADAALYQTKSRKAVRASWWQLGVTPDLTSALTNPPDHHAAAAPEPEAYRQLLLADGLLMYMQPVVQLQTGAIQHIEALARLRMPDHAIVPPDVFLPFLGQPELNELFRRGLHQALGWLATWDLAGLKLRISINLLPSTLRDPACPDWIAQALTRHGIEPYRLSIELLETEALDSTEQQAEALANIAALGVELMMDDLGSGYASLSRFTALDFNAVKIDRGLTAHVRTKPRQTLSLLRALIDICRDFKRRVVAEGLEDAGMVEALAVLGADCGQGNAIAKAMPAEKLAAWLQDFTFASNPHRPTTPLGTLARALATEKA